MLISQFKCATAYLGSMNYEILHCLVELYANPLDKRWQIALKTSLNTSLKTLCLDA